MNIICKNLLPPGMLGKTGKKELHLLFFRSGGRTGGYRPCLLCIAKI